MKSHYASIKFLMPILLDLLLPIYAISMQTLIQAIIIVGLDIVDYSLEVDKKRVGKRIKNDMKSSAVKLNKNEKANDSTLIYL